MSKFTVGRVMNAVVTVMAAHGWAKLSCKAISEIVGVSETAVEAWVAKRNILDGSYIDVIEGNLAPMVKAHIDARRMQILADLGSEYGERVKKAIELPSYGAAKAAAITRKAGFQRRGTKYTSETVAEKNDLAKKVKWIGAELSHLTQREIAERVGCEASTMSSWLNGRNTPATTFGPKIEALYNHLKAEKKEMLKAAGVKQPEAPVPVVAPLPPPPPPMVAPLPAPSRDRHEPNMLIRVGADGAELTVRSGVTLLIEDGKYLDLQELGTHTFRLTLPNNLSVRINK